MPRESILKDPKGGSAFKVRGSKKSIELTLEDARIDKGRQAFLLLADGSPAYVDSTVRWEVRDAG